MILAIFMSAVSTSYRSSLYSTGELIKCVGRDGGKEGEFDDPRGLTLCDNLVGKGVLFGGVLIERGSIYIFCQWWTM